MDRSTQKFDRLLQKTNPGFSFTRSQRSLDIPHNNTFLADENLQYHYASNTQKMYSPFQQKYYLPPHLNSSQSYGLLHKAQCKSWKVRTNQNSNFNLYHKQGDGKQNMKSKLIKGRHVWNMTTNYDTQYRLYEQKFKNLPKKKYEEIHPRIKYLVDQDKPTMKSPKPRKLYNQQDDIQ